MNMYSIVIRSNCFAGRMASFFSFFFFLSFTERVRRTYINYSMRLSVSFFIFPTISYVHVYIKQTMGIWSRVAIWLLYVPDAIA